MLNSLKLSLKLLRRDFRAGELQVLLFAVIIAVASVASVSFFTDRLQLALVEQASDLLGADFNVVSDHALDTSYFEQARTKNLTVSQQQSFPSMAVSENANQLVMLKAVDGSFPLRGSVKIADAPFAADRKAQGGPARGTVWVDPVLIQSLKISVGGEISLGTQLFKVTAVITNEPGGGGVFALAPRVMMNLDDLAATQLVQPASRVQYTVSVAGDRKDVKSFNDYVEQKNERGLRVQDVRNAQPQVQSALTRAQQFLGLAALTSVILAGVAIALAARRYAQRHLDQCAIMRCVGAKQSTVSQIYLLQIVLLGLFASIVGTLLGFAAHYVLVELLGSMLGVTLPNASWVPVLGGFATGMVTLVAFSLPPLLQLQKVPALRVLRRDLGALKAPGWIAYALGILGLAALMVWQARDIKLGVYMTSGSIIALFTLALLSLLLMSLLKPLRKQSRGSWLFGIANLLRRRNASIVQIVAFGLGMMALLMLTIVRGDLLDTWGKTLPADAPNRFIINIQPDQVESMKQYFQSELNIDPEFYPMIRGRLTKINDNALDVNSFQSERARNLAEREFNLSWAEQPTPGNKITAGNWWSENDRGRSLVSMEKGIAETLQLHLGHKLTFKVGSEEFTVEVSNLREVNWDSFRANFFAITNPGVMDAFPSTNMTSFYLPAERVSFLNRLVAQYPNITVIDVASVMKQVRDIISRVTLAVEYVFLFTLAAGLMVLFAGIQSTQDERMIENAIVRTLGGSRRQIRTALLSEFAVLGLLAGVLAAGLATVLAFVIADKVLSMPFYFNGWMWLYGIVGGTLGVGFAGLLGSRSVLNQPPLQTLRKIAF